MKKNTGFAVLFFSLVLTLFAPTTSFSADPDLRGNFMEGCMGSCTATPSIGPELKGQLQQYCDFACNCSYDGLEAKYSTNQLVENFTKMGNGASNDEFMNFVLNVAQNCSAQGQKKFPDLF